MPASPAPGHIIAFRNDRLGARLITLVNALRLCHGHDLSLRIHWNIATDIGHIFNDPAEFFAQTLIDAHFIDNDSFRQMRDNSIRIRDIGPGGITALRAKLATGVNVLVDSAFDMTCLDGEDPADVRRQSDLIWHGFPFAASLALPLAEIASKVAGGTAYHIRRGDLTSFPRAMNRSWPNKYIPDEFYMLHMERVLANGTRPVLFSDDAETITRFHSRFPDLILAGSLFNATAVTPGQRDLLELFAMSRCARIVAPGNSAFSSTAATLGGAVKTDVTLDFAPADQQAAKERLVARLSTGAPAWQGEGEGDIGQSLQHLALYLGAQGRGAEAARVISGYIDRGLNISFIYPLGIELHLDHGNHQAARAIAGIMAQRGTYHRKDYGKGEILHAVAQFAQGETAAGCRHAANAFWHEPDQSYVREAVGVLLETGVLSDRNFLPLSPAARQLRRRSAPNVSANPCFAPLRSMLDRPVTDYAAVPSLDALQWDWFAFMRAATPMDVAGHAHRAGFEKTFAKIRKRGSTPDSDSLEALFDMHVAPGPGPLARLQALAAAHPADAWVQHRHSVAALMLRSYDTAMLGAVAAARAAPDMPAHIAWRGMLRIRAKQFTAAITDLSTAIASGLALPRLYLLLAQTQARVNDIGGAMTTLAQGIALSPLDQEFRFLRARLLADLDRPDAALADLDVLARNDGRAPKVLLLHAACLRATGRLDAAQALLQRGLEHAPTQAGLRDELAKVTLARRARSTPDAADQAQKNPTGPALADADSSAKT